MQDDSANQAQKDASVIESSTSAPIPTSESGRLSLSAADRRAAADVAGAALRDRIGLLITALGEPDHPLHQRAIDDLVTIGPPAVVALVEALKPNRSWLTAYRAADALGQIGDGRAAGGLMEALQHPNSNVRWSAVRALTIVGDARTILELRRVAREDRGKTSWGESVSAAAQTALDHMQGRNLLIRGFELVKTAIACVLMLGAITVMWNLVGALRAEYRTFGVLPAGESMAPIVRTAEPLPTAMSAPAVMPTLMVTATTGITTTTGITATVLATGNVRSAPIRRNDNVVGVASEGDVVRVLASTADRLWFRIAFVSTRSSASRIDTGDGTGWVGRTLIDEPKGAVPLEQPVLPTVAPASP